MSIKSMIITLFSNQEAPPGPAFHSVLSPGETLIQNSDIETLEFRLDSLIVQYRLGLRGDMKGREGVVSSQSLARHSLI